ncbi:MAG: FHA domain-containing protein [Proteobacteria bacterium]|nr:FHA domain-containing protein [Pseudomonadota bacterium]
MGALDGGLETSLELTVQGPRLSQPRRIVLGAEQLAGRGAWIGRGHDCAVPLADPDRFVSLYHARLGYADGGFWLTDQSTNGTTVLGAAGAAPVRLSKGGTHRLAAGERLRIGMFEIAVRFGEGLSAPADPLADLDLSPGGAPSGLRDPLAGLAAVSPAPPGAETRPVLGNPLGAGVEASGADAFDTILAELTGGPDLVAMPRFETGAPAPPAAEAAAAKDRPEPPPDRRPAPAGDMLDAITSEVAVSVPSLRADQVVSETGQPQRDTATMALAAFWCGLGVIPRSLRPEELVEVMAQLGMAFREAADGLAAIAASHGPYGEDPANPFVAGHAGLRRYIDGRSEADRPLDTAVREILGRAADFEAVRAAATRAGVHAVAQSLSATAIEKRIGPAVVARRPRSRRAELWRMFSLMQDDLIALAELGFDREVEDRMSRAGLRRRRTTDGLDP